MKSKELLELFKGWEYIKEDDRLIVNNIHFRFRHYVHDADPKVGLTALLEMQLGGDWSSSKEYLLQNAVRIKARIGDIVGVESMSRIIGYYKITSLVDQKDQPLRLKAEFVQGMKDSLPVEIILFTEITPLGFITNDANEFNLDKSYELFVCDNRFFEEQKMTLLLEDLLSRAESLKTNIKNSFKLMNTDEIIAIQNAIDSAQTIIPQQ